MSRPDYGLLARMLHHLALGPGLVREACFDMQATALAKKTLPEVVRPVFIAGLARSGSTMLLNSLYQTGEFRSLTYRDMPFVLMPGIWQSMSRGSQAESVAKERAHGDRLSVDYDSPEAFEEVFWRTFCAEDYVSSDKLTPHAPGPGTRRKYTAFVKSVLASSSDSGHKRYLAKNNNNLLRLPTLTKTFPDAQILVPFRDPLQHAMSLLRQHQLFCASHADDRFNMHYMHWLGHWEFGLSHKNYAYTGTDNPFQPDDINYWLNCWLDAYTHALASAPEGALFINYEQLCADPVRMLGGLMSELQIDCDVESVAARYQAAQTHHCSDYKQGIFDDCHDLYERLRRTWQV